MSVRIGDKKTYEDWGLKLISITVGFPEAKTNQVDVPGSDGMMDLTEVLGYVRYGNRPLSLVFDLLAPPEKWHTTSSMIANYLHGQHRKVILETDPDYYYVGRLTLDSEKSSYTLNRITITGNMDPYKYEMYSGMEKWKWNSFNFRTGIIRNYKDLVVDGVRTVRINGRRKPVVPIFISSTDMQVEWRGMKYPLPAGKSKIYEISIPEGENQLAFYGTGTVSIDYRGGIL